MRLWVAEQMDGTTEKDRLKMNSGEMTSLHTFCMDKDTQTIFLLSQQFFLVSVVLLFSFHLSFFCLKLAV